MDKRISLSLLILLPSLSVGFIFIPYKKELSFNECREKKHSNEAFCVVLRKKNYSNCQDFERLLQTPKRVYYAELTNKETMREWSTFIRENKILHTLSMFRIDNGHLKRINGEGDADQLFANYQKITKQEEQKGKPSFLNERNSACLFSSNSRLSNNMRDVLQIYFGLVK